MTELFAYEYVSGKYLPALADSWVLEEPSIIRRIYKGETLRLTKRGWQYKQPFEFVIGESGRMWDWEPIYPKSSFWRDLRKALSADRYTTWPLPESPFSGVDKFEAAEVKFVGEDEKLPLGLYTLTENALIPNKRAEQLSNLQALDLHEQGFNWLADGEQVLALIQQAVAPMRNDVYGASFVPLDETKEEAVIYFDRFDWTDYE
jgi:hypothetical protein